MGGDRKELQAHEQTLPALGSFDMSMCYPFAETHIKTCSNSPAPFAYTLGNTNEPELTLPSKRSKHSQSTWTREHFAVNVPHHLKQKAQAGLLSQPGGLGWCGDWL